MREGITPITPDIEWWRKPQAQAEIEWRVLPGTLPVREWLFDAEAVFCRAYKGYRVFWLRGWLRFIGIRFGAAVFWRGPAIADQSPKGRDAQRLDAKHASGGPEGNRHD